MNSKQLSRTKIQIAIAFGCILLLLVPFLAMQFTEEVNWDIIDFVIGGSLLLTSGLIIEFVIRKVRNTRHGKLIALGVIVVLVLLWMELAVGIFNSPIAGS